MLRYFLILACGAFLNSGVSYAIELMGPKYPPTKGEVWPKPQYQKKSSQYYSLDTSQFKVNTTKQTCSILTKAIERYSFIVRNTVRHHSVPSRLRRVAPNGSPQDDYQGHLNELVIELLTPCEGAFPSFNMNESYDLIVSSTSKLSADSIWGVLRGLETWSQLFYASENYAQVYINATIIRDYPRYSHRGVMLDTSRHFLSLSNILKNLDAMVMNKMNVFHWHIVDDQSFPYQSEKFPGLSGKGAYHSSMVYTKSDIAKVVEYASERGIRVIAEFDVPGHTRSWGAKYPDILAKCYGSNGKMIGLGPMDPTSDSVYPMLKNLFQEVQAWFPDKYFHIGGDEVDLNCWSSNPDITKFMKAHNLTTSQLHGYFMQKVIPLLGGGTVPIVWQEVFDEGVHLPPDTIVQVWKWGWLLEMVTVLKAGYQVIFSSSWYLDHLKSGGDWTDFYLADPRQMVASWVDNTTSLKIVGGEACMWGEVVDDTNVISRTWPRASATAERLWSAELPRRAHAAALDDAARRLEEHACRMRRRGVRAQPPNGPGYCVGAA